MFLVFLGIVIFYLSGFTAQRWIDNISSIWEGLSFEILFLYLSMLPYILRFFSLVALFCDKATSCHEIHNKSNIDKQPIKWFLSTK